MVYPGPNPCRHGRPLSICAVCAPEAEAALLKSREKKPERITGSELASLELGERDSEVWLQPLVAEVRRLQGLIQAWYATYSRDPDDLMTVGEERALLAEGSAISKEE